ncbi:MAG: HAD-IB family hydrolase [Micrococcales bacterium]|nr:HAD-IB family hydrolase [Micrococcales bacterium]
MKVSKAPAAPTVSQPPPGSAAAFFDIDNTVIRGASAFHLARMMRRRGLVSRRSITHLAWRNLRYRILGERQRDIEATRAESLAIIGGIPVAEILVAGEQLYDEVLALRIFPGTQELIDQHREAGHEVWFVSATPTEVGTLMAGRLGATGALGTNAERKDGFYTGDLQGDLLHGQAKADAVEKLASERGFDLAHCFAYSDSINDAPLLRLVGNPCGINPDRRLRALCAQQVWPVREFRGRRRAVRRPLRAASNVGAWWAALTVVWAVLRRLAPHRRRPRPRP